MSPHKENDLLYLLNILEYSGKIWKYTEDIANAEEFYEYNDQLNLNASLNKIVHNYEGIDIEVVFEIITQDLRELKPKIEQIIAKKTEEKIFSIDELNLAKESEFYKYVDFAVFC